MLKSFIFDLDGVIVLTGRLTRIRGFCFRSSGGKNRRHKVSGNRDAIPLTASAWSRRARRTGRFSWDITRSDSKSLSLVASQDLLLEYVRHEER